MDYNYALKENKNLTTFLDDLLTSNRKMTNKSKRCDLVIKKEYLSKKRLNLYNYNLTKIPESISNLYYVKEILASKNNFKAFPEAITQLKQLDYLDLSINKITSIPESIGNLTKLRCLIINDNKLTELPESIAKLEANLIIDHNYLKKLPDSIRSNRNIMDSLNDPSCFNGLYPSGDYYFFIKDELIKIKNSILLSNNELTCVDKQYIEENIELSNDIFISIMPEVKNINNNNYLTNLLNLPN